MTRGSRGVVLLACLLTLLGFGGVDALTQTYSRSGTGFVVASSGYILTSYHVVEGAAGPITVTLSNGTKHEARVIDSSPTTDKGGYDAALLKIEASGLPVIPVANSDEVQLFDQVVVLGYPLSFDLGISLNVTGGNITAFRKIKDSPELLQIDAVVNPGNSGGPALDTMGRAVGIVTSKIVGEEIEGISFLVPINHAAGLVAKHVPGWALSTADAVLTSREIVAAATPAIVYVEWSDVFVEKGEYNETFATSREWFAEFWNPAGFIEYSEKDKNRISFIGCPADAVGPTFEVEILFSQCGQCRTGATCVSGCYAGLAFFPSDTDENQWKYAVVVNPNGQYLAYKKPPGDNTTWVHVGTRTTSSNLKQGIKVVNRLTISVVGKKTTVSFNGASPGTLGIEIPLGGTVALCVINSDAATVVRFDNLRIRSLPGEKSDMEH